MFTPEHTCIAGLPTSSFAGVMVTYLVLQDSLPYASQAAGPIFQTENWKYEIVGAASETEPSVATFPFGLIQT